MTDWLIQSLKAPIQAQITVPSDKQITVSAILLAAIAEGESYIGNPLMTEDVFSLILALQAFGVTIDYQEEAQMLWVKGVGKHGLKDPNNIVNIGGSEWVLFPLIGLLAGHGITAIIEGNFELMHRAVLPLIEPLHQMQAHIYCAESGFLPLRIQRTKTRLKSIDYQLSKMQSLAKPMVLMAALFAEGETVLEEPWNMPNHFEHLLGHFSYPLTVEKNIIRLQGGHRLKPVQLNIPSDFSMAATLIAAVAMIPGAHLIIDDVGINPTRTTLLHLLWQMGAHITVENPTTVGGELIGTLEVRGGSLNGIQIKAEDALKIINELPILMIVAGMAKGKTFLPISLDENNLRTLIDGLKGLGIVVEENEDGLVIQGGKYCGGRVSVNNDATLAFAFAMVACVSAEPIYISGTEAIDSIFYDTKTILGRLGLKMEEKGQKDSSRSLLKVLENCFSE